MPVASAAVRSLSVPVTVLLSLAVAAACGSDDGAAGGTATSAGSTTTAGPETTATAEPDTSVPGSGTTAAPPATGREPGGGPVVVVDPGHNGANAQHPEVVNEPVDAGGFQKACNTTGTATDDGTSESSINWAVALLLRDRLEAAGAEVILTRADDRGVGPCIDQRARVAAEARADLLVSVHADGAPAATRGFHVIHPALRPGYTDGTAGPSAELATAVRDALVAAGFTPSTSIGDGGLVERDDLGTLNLAQVPAVMVEAGNLRNGDDAAVLTSPDGQARLADALATAALSFAG
jgi:N-acetylmuramoyl-L-alanine amidase